MTMLGSRRRRTAFVASAAAVTVLMAASMAGAHQGNRDTDVLHLCVRTGDGQLRAVGPSGPNCRRGERAVHVPMTQGNNNDALEAFMADLIAADHPDDLVHWNNLAGVPDGLVTAAEGWLADGAVDYADIQGLSAALADGQVTWDEIQSKPTVLADGQVAYGELTGSLPDNSVTGATVDDESLTGSDIDDGTLTAADLAGSYGDPFVAGAVTGEKIADGSVENRDLADGAVTPGKTTPVVASATSDVGRVLLTGGTDVPESGGAAVATSGPSVVMVTAQVQLTLALPCLPCTTATAYQVVRTTGATTDAVSPTYQVQLSEPGHLTDVAAVSIVDNVPAGSHSYKIRLLTTDGTVTHRSAVVNAQVLGLTG